MYDVIVVGARCSGSLSAMLLALKGARVLLLDRATFPSDTSHGHFIHRDGPQRLQRWGLLDAIAAKTPAISSGIHDGGDFPLRFDGLVENGVAWAYGPRRSTLDKILVDAAVAAGAELREGFTVDEYLFDEGRLAGIRGHDKDANSIEERATITVGADGRRSNLARAVDAPVYNDAGSLLCYYFSYWSGVESEAFELYHRPEQRRVVFAFKTEHDQLAVFAGLPVEELPAFREDIEASFMLSLASAGDLGERVWAGHREERFYGATDLPNFYRKPYGPGWALVGDAGLHKDPYMALGICDGLRDAEFLAEAIGAGLSGSGDMETALAAFEQRRNEASNADYQENLAQARLLPQPPEVSGLRAAVRNSPEDVTLLMKARMGMIERGAFFNPSNLQRIMGGQPATAP
jgi:flavin-dependent dehydrogenase